MIGMREVCHRCGGEVPAGSGESPFCPHCGAPQLYLSVDYQSGEESKVRGPHSTRNARQKHTSACHTDQSSAYRRYVDRCGGSTLVDCLLSGGAWFWSDRLALTMPFPCSRSPWRCSGSTLSCLGTNLFSSLGEPVLSGNVQLVQRSTASCGLPPADGNPSRIKLQEVTAIDSPPPLKGRGSPILPAATRSSPFPDAYRPHPRSCVLTAIAPWRRPTKRQDL